MSIAVFSFPDSDSRNKTSDRFKKKWGEKCVEIIWTAPELVLHESCDDLDEAKQIARLYGGKVKEN